MTSRSMLRKFHAAGSLGRKIGAVGNKIGAANAAARKIEALGATWRELNVQNKGQTTWPKTTA